jgi:hypothetical protein
MLSPLLTPFSNPHILFTFKAHHFYFHSLLLTLVQIIWPVKQCHLIIIYLWIYLLYIICSFRISR